MKRFNNVLALVVAMQLILVVEAQAYLDPGTGSFIFQTIVAMVVGAAFTLKLYWQRVKGFFLRKPALPAEARPEPRRGDDRIA
jgi:hypothetical protein